MSKRRRSSTVSDTKDDDEPLSPTPSMQNKRRKKVAPPQDPSEIIHDLYEAIRNHKTGEDNKLLCEAFIRAPKRRSDPEYFNVVSNPIDLLRVQSKIKMDEYDTVEQLTSDIHLLVSNAKAYYKRGTQEYQDACAVWQLYQEKKKEMTTSDEDDDDNMSEAAESSIEEDAEEEREEEEEEEEGEVPEDNENRAESTKRPTFKLPQEEMIPLTVDVRSPEIKSAESKCLSSSGSQYGSHISTSTPSANTSDTNLPSKIEEYTLDNPDDLLEQLFTAVMALKDSDGRIVSLLFQKLPSKAQFPGYYEVIEEPIDLKAIAKKLKAKEYADLNELENDLTLMVKNAKKFNEPGSQVHKDAISLKKLISNKKSELFVSLKSPTPSSAAATSDEKPNASDDPSTSQAPGSSTDKPPGQSAISAAANISSDEDEDDPSPAAMEYEDDESGNESFLSDSNDALHLLYDSVAGAKDSLGHLISEPFMRLPSRRVYPDYYEEIENPIALGKIKQRIKGRKYDSLEELAADLDLLFKNAKEYNEPKSKLFKDADHLQRLMLIKKKDLDKTEIIKPEVPVSEDEGPEKKKRGRKSLVAGVTGAATAVTTPTAAGETKKRGRESNEGKNYVKNVLLTLVDALVKYKDKNNQRFPIAIFIEKPSKKLYPDYYKVITEPIDMRTIEASVRNDKYSGPQALIADLELMFNNARHYNEESSQVYQDANFLEKLMKDKCKELHIPIHGYVATKTGHTPKSAGSTPTSSKKPSHKKQATAAVPPSPSKINNPLYHKLQDMYETIMKNVDANGRELSPPFITLPLKNEYPEYYQVIKKPVDMQKIQQRMQLKQYENLDEMVNDFLLMFDNACKFNEPDSLIYKDALTLQRVLLQCKTELMGDESSGVPDVQSLVREVLTNLFVSLANYQDEEGRCFSDSLAEVPFDKESLKEKEDSTEGSQKKPLDLDTVRRYLDRGCYRRLDCFQDHIFEVLDRARNLTRTDSQVYEDSIEMQRFFIKVRDEVCKNGEILLSPALSYTHRHLQNDLDKQKKEKLPKEMKEDAEKKQEEDETKGDAGKDAPDMQGDNVSNDDGLLVHGQTYRIGDFCYVEPSDKTLKPHIVCIEKLWKDPDGECWLHGNWFLRPNETFHLATRKFLEKEVFKSDYYNKVKMSQHVISKCHVMFVKDYFKSKPESFDENDVFVCESRYSAKAKAFKKIKIWSAPAGSSKIVPREEPLSKVRVESVFADGKISHLPVMENADEHWTVFDKEREAVVVDVPNGDEGCVYYEQLNFNHYVYKLGDSVYLRSDQSQPFIARIDKMWKDSNGDPWFHGPWFVRPAEVEHPPTRMFYKNEVFLSSIEDTNPMRSICGKCAVLPYKDYIVSRPTEFSEDHMFVAESSYKEAERSIRKIKALKKYQVSNKVIDDEVYFFKKPITPLKEPSPLLRQPENDADADETESMVTTMTDNQDAIETESKKTDDDAETSSIISTPARSTKTPKPRHASGYILFASEVRAAVKQQNPEMTFGEISRFIGSDWRNLPPEEKGRYEERAQAIAAEKALLNEGAASSPAPAPKRHAAGSVQIWECGWEGCDYQYEEQEDLFQHVTSTSGHLQGQPKPNDERETEYPCKWKNCARNRKNQPFPMLARLIRHCKEVHVKTATKHYQPQSLSRNYFSKSAVQNGGAPGRPGTPGASGAVMGIVGPPTPVGMSMGGMQDSQGYGPASGGSTPGMHPSMQQQYGYNQSPGIQQQQQQHPGMQPYHQQQQMLPPPQMQQQYSSMQPPYHQQPHGGQYPNQNMGMHPPQAVGMYGNRMTPQAPSHMMSSPHVPNPQVPYGSPYQSPAPMVPSQYGQVGQGGQNSAPMHPAQPPAPLFVPPPPKTQRLLHSEAYIRYIEGLNTENTSVSNWQKSLSVKQHDIQLDPQQRSRLPGHWLANGPGPEGDLVNSLWKLRDMMMHDSLRISKSKEIDILAVEPECNPEQASYITIDQL